MTGQVWVPQKHAAARWTSSCWLRKEGTSEKKRFEEKGLRFQAQGTAVQGTEATRKRPENELECEGEGNERKVALTPDKGVA